MTSLSISILFLVLHVLVGLGQACFHPSHERPETNPDHPRQDESPSHRLLIPEHSLRLQLQPGVVPKIGAAGQCGKAEASEPAVSEVINQREVHQESHIAQDLQEVDSPCDHSPVEVVPPVESAQDHQLHPIETHYVLRETLPFQEFTKDSIDYYRQDYAGTLDLGQTLLGKAAINGLWAEVYPEELETLRDKEKEQGSPAQGVLGVDEMGVVFKNSLKLRSLVVFFLLSHYIRWQIPLSLYRAWMKNAPTTPMQDIAMKSVCTLQRGPWIPRKVQKPGLPQFRMMVLPTMLPSGCIPACRYPAREGSSSSLMAMASTATSPILTSRTSTNRIAMTNLYSSCLSARNASGYVRIDAASKLPAIHDFLLPQDSRVNFSTRGAVTNLKLKGRMAMEKSLRVWASGNQGQRQTMVEMKERKTPCVKQRNPTSALTDRLGEKIEAEGSGMVNKQLTRLLQAMKGRG